MTLFSSKRRVVIAATAILVILFLLRPGVSRVRWRIAGAISRAVARPVDIGSVHLRFLPRPGFDLENVVIHEDPAFGAEPMLRAPEVTGIVRLTSLLRGRLEFSRLELTEPSLNLVRSEDGRWNWEALLERTTHSPLAPTSKSKSEARPGFPYIEASSGRINFKAGQEKKSYALLNADFALWQESENAWGMRLKAEPLRTDMSMSDTGLLQMSGTWQRAGKLRETPLQFSLEWNRAQLGQLTKLVTGSDKGWRGEVRLDATLAGIPAAMQVAADASIQGFHRYDISSSEELRLAAHCDAKYSSAEGMMHEIFCNAPVGDGMITLHGDAGLPGMRRVNLSLSIEGVPVNAVSQLARRAKKNLPTDLVAAGKVQGSFLAKEDAVSKNGVEFGGRGEITELRLQSASNRVDLSPGSMPFVLGSSSGHDWLKNKASWLSKAGERTGLDELEVEYGPFPVALGRAAPAQVRGWVRRSGYGMVVKGDGEVSRTLRAAALLGLPVTKANVEGVVQMDLLVAGSWAKNISETSSGFSLPDVTGTVQLRNLKATVRGVNGPIEVSSAELDLSPQEARVEKFNARAADTHWTGSVTLPRACGTPGACLVHFNVNTEEVGLRGLREWLSAPPSERRWYQVLSEAQPAPPTFLNNLRASGKVSAGRMLIHELVASHVSAALDLENGRLKISDWRADVLGGKHRGDWQIDFATGAPVYTGSGTLSAISMERVAGAMHDPWISGTGSGTYQFKSSGKDSTEFWQSAQGWMQFDLQDGVLAHIMLANEAEPLHLLRWQGRARLNGGKIEIEPGKLVSTPGTYEIDGSASLSRILDLKLTQGAENKPGSAGSTVYRITGTLAEPRVAATAAAETQAALKP